MMEARVVVLLSAMLASLGAIHGSQHSRPEVKVMVMQKGLSYANNILVSKIVQEIEGLRIPSVKPRSSLTLYHSAVTSAVIKSTALLADGSMNALTLILDLQRIQIQGSYMSDFWFGTSVGYYDLNLNKVRITKHLAIGKDELGRPTVSSKSCQTVIEDSKMTFSKGTSAWTDFILTTLVAIARKTIQTKIENLMCQSITAAIIEKGEDIPKAYSAARPVDNCSAIEFPLLDNPTIKHGQIDFFLQGNVSSTCRPLIYSRSRGASRVFRVDPLSPDKMLHVVIGDDLVNTLLELRYWSKKLDIGFIGGMGVSIKLTTPPVYTTTPDGATIRAPAVVSDNNISVSMAFTASVIISENNGSLVFEIIQISLVRTQLIKAGADGVTNKMLLDVITRSETEIVERLNRIFSNTLPLPLIRGMILQNNEISYDQGVTILSSDFLV
ncbi:uncharacterized protein LOC5519830 [Nematostella vectensis]|uniref:uncharacterized protein LOC5519830 n=1 Tax=Nematostella vectensis TaxID=45351 RepID=UPI0020770E0F|nr:uncharacterized protein LOC5519830 [Nematostella vectensis]